MPVSELQERPAACWVGSSALDGLAWFLRCGLPPVLRGHFHLEAEAAVEVRNVVVSAFEGDGFDRQGTFFEQAGGVVDAQVVNVVQPGFAEDFSKVTGE